MVKERVVAVFVCVGFDITAISPSTQHILSHEVFCRMGVNWVIVSHAIVVLQSTHSMLKCSVTFRLK